MLAKHEKIKVLNEYLTRYLYSQRQSIIDRRNVLQKRFGNDYGAMQMHVSSLCVPSKVITDDDTVFREFKPNVRWVEGIGLISTADICENEFLIDSSKIKLDHGLKMTVYNSIQPQLVTNKMNKICLYQNTI